MIRRTKEAGDGREERIIGLDLLRLGSMLMVVVLHILGQGGILNAAPPGSTAWYVAWGLECVCYCAVDCYGLLSGYLGGSRKRPYTGLALLWLEVVLYSLLYYALFRFLFPEQVGEQALLNACFPALKRQYWYFTGYFGLTLLMPLLNGGLESVEPGRATGMAVLLPVFFSALPFLLYTDAFHLRGGYTMLWLLLLYLMGALLRKSDFFQRLGLFPLILIAILCNALTFATVLRPVTVLRLGSFTLLNYCSPTVLADAVCLLLLFSRLRLRPGWFSRMITGLSKCSFGVYILHTNPLLWQLVFRSGCLQGWASLGARRLAVLVPACAVGVYLCCSLPEQLRALVFQRLRLRERAEGLEQRLLGGKGQRNERGGAP